MFKILKQPYPSNLIQFDVSSNTTSLVAGVSVFFILSLLRPFGLDTFPIGQLLKNAFIFGLVTAGAVRLNLAVFKYLFNKKVFREEEWTVGNEAATQVWILVFIGILNTFVHHYFLNCPLTSLTFLDVFGKTIIVGIFPSLSFVFIRQYRLLKMYSSTAEAIEAKLSIDDEVVISSQVEIAVNRKSDAISFSDDSVEDDIPLQPASIRYIVAADNYIRIFFMEDKTLKNLLLRNTLKNVEEKLIGYNNFYRCHRSYLINLHAVKHISGNAQGYKLHLDGVEDLIPVSRSLNAEIGEKLTYSQKGKPAM